MGYECCSNQATASHISRIATLHTERLKTSSAIRLSDNWIITTVVKKNDKIDKSGSDKMIKKPAIPKISEILLYLKT